MWVVNAERMIRYHPDSQSDRYNILFYKDAILGIEILLQQKIVLQYLNKWITDKRAILRKHINLISQKIEINIEAINSMIYEMGNIYDLLSDNFIIQRNIGHSFFNLLVEDIIDKMRIKEILSSNKESLSEFFTLITSISSQLMMNKSNSIDDLNYKMSLKADKTNQLMWILSIIMAIVSLTQLVLAFIDGLHLIC